MVQAQVRDLLQRSLGGRWDLRGLRASGFCDTWQAAQATRRLFVKSAPATGAQLLGAEADGLRALAATGTVRVPQVACVENSAAGTVLALEWLDMVPPDRGFGRRLGEALAALHAHPVPLEPPAFGWRRDNFIGATPQRNPPMRDWVAFVAQARLGAMQRWLQPGAPLVAAIDRVIALLPQLFARDLPSPSLIHGDLWHGNWGMLADGTPVVFDPAVSCSDAEAELAMMELFGAPPAGFSEAYGGRRDRRRTQVYQLYHLLNHAVLFGGGYGQQALRLARAI